MDTQQALFRYNLRLGDTNLILGHRLSEMCSRGPMLEEDIALTNIALDHIGQAEALLDYAGTLEGLGRTGDDLAYLRPEWEYYNLLLAEQPNTDFAFVIVRQFMIDTYQCLLYDHLRSSKDETLAGMASRFLKETLYHQRHSRNWVFRLGLGTEESHSRLTAAVNELWKYAGELFESDEVESILAAAGIIPNPASLREPWLESVRKDLRQASVPEPPASHAATGGRNGRHGEQLGHLLAEMQYLQRAFPGAAW
ncbi:MAG: phenylacetate-CoA oxygenase subunit PaaC [Lewinellaceae bacterium]|nr:phenylacetate-CoA oxygenase subunit PaaC [Lewinellaceae bacterium]